jgi:hypothetical protein
MRMNRFVMLFASGEPLWVPQKFENFKIN